MTSRLVRTIGALALLLSAACAQPTQLLVEVTVASDLPPIAVAIAEVRDEVGTRIDGPRSFEVAPGGSSFVVVPRAGDASRVARVLVSGCRSPVEDGAPCPLTDVVATQAFSATFVPGRVVRVRVVLSALCVGTTCPVDTVCTSRGARAVCEPFEAPDAGMDGGRDAAGFMDAPDARAVADALDARVVVDARRDGGPDAGNVDAFEPCPNFDLGNRLGAVATGNTTGAADDFTPTCSAGSLAPDHTFSWTAPSTATYTFDTIGSTFDTVLSLLRGCGGPSLTCNDDITPGTTSTITRLVTEGEMLLVVVDGFNAQAGTYRLNITSTATLDAGPDAARDGGARDGGPADVGLDAATDASGLGDAAIRADGGAPDAPVADAASNDAASNDAASNDAASNDAASNDAASNDAASVDAGPDANAVDAAAAEDASRTDAFERADAATDDAP